MVMHRSFMTVALASVLVGGLGLSAFSQTSPAPTGQGSQGVESSEPFQHRQGGGRGHGGGHSGGLEEAAAQLGVSEADLKAALGLPAERPPRPDLAATATQLGISETDLQEALHSNRRAARQEGELSRGQALAATAAQLGMSEADLKTALGLPAEPPPRPDLATAAAQLGVSETDLRDALQSARGGRGCGQEEPAAVEQPS